MTVNELLARCKQGDRLAENELMAIYFDRVAANASQMIGAKYRSKFDGEDIAVSALKSLANQLREGLVEIDDEKHFLAKLFAIVQNKVHHQIEYWTALKRGVCREVSDNQSSSDREPLPELIHHALSREPSPEEAVVFTEELLKLRNRLDERTLDRFSKPSCKEVLDARREGKDYITICEDVKAIYGRDISTKAIYYRIKAIQEVLEEIALEEFEE
jgi:hypothetical protein